MLRYKIGGKVVPKRGLESPRSWFENEFVLIVALNKEDYTVEPANQFYKDYSWIDDEEIDHETTEIINKEQK